jgi:hypothetical protein
MSKFIKLLTSAYVNGRMRHTDEGVLHLDDDEAQRLLDNKSGEDVTADFSADDHKNTPVEGLRAASDNDRAAADLTPVDHQANIAPVTDTAKAAPKAPAKKGD